MAQPLSFVCPPRRPPINADWGKILLLSAILVAMLYGITNPDVALRVWRRDPSAKGNPEGRVIVNTTDLSLPGRTLWVVTTACMPWRTGTSVNPTLRAAYLLQETRAKKVNLVVPWVGPEDQVLVFGQTRFAQKDEQEAVVRKWLHVEANMPHAAANLGIVFYEGRYIPEYGSIFPTEDILALIPEAEADVAILEEPEHLNWFHPETDEFWRHKFNHVVGVIHTNYLAYAAGEPGGKLKTPFVYLMNRWMVGAHCHRVIKLSGVLQSYAPDKEVVSNVHGVRADFLKIGDWSRQAGFSEGAYMIGKMLWAKGFPQLFNIMALLEKKSKKGRKTKKPQGQSLHVDVYGSGPDRYHIIKEAEHRGYNLTFHQGADHISLDKYKIMINPSVSEVLCTTSAEALAMGKFLICPVHLSNAFFAQFPNCLQYKNLQQAAQQVEYAQRNTPAPLSPEHRRLLTWEAATERFVKASQMTEQEYGKEWKDNIGENFHQWVTQGKRGKAVRRLAGGQLLDE